jgi:hypothetical protein
MCTRTSLLNLEKSIDPEIFLSSSVIRPLRPSIVLLTSVAADHLLHMIWSAQTTANSILIVIQVIALLVSLRLHHAMMMSILWQWR